MKNHDDEIIISYFLKAGVMISVSFIIVGINENKSTSPKIT